LHISPFREDGVTHSTPTWIWSVAVDDALYVRGYDGQNSRWYRRRRRQHHDQRYPAVPPTEISPKQADSMKTRLRIEDKVITATLMDSKTTRILFPYCR
jgi:hypothetical protein